MMDDVAAGLGPRLSSGATVMTKKTRRQFLEDSMFAAAAAAAAASTPMIGFAADPPAKDPNEKLLCAVVGCRGRGGSG